MPAMPVFKEALRQAASAMLPLFQVRQAKLTCRWSTKLTRKLPEYTAKHLRASAVILGGFAVPCVAPLCFTLADTQSGKILNAHTPQRRRQELLNRPHFYIPSLSSSKAEHQMLLRRSS